MTSLTAARCALKKTLIDAGYAPDFVASKVPDATMTASVIRFKGDNQFTIQCGCDYRLPDATRTQMWAEFGARLCALLHERGFAPDLKPFGSEVDHRTIVVIIN